MLWLVRTNQNHNCPNLPTSNSNPNHYATTINHELQRLGATRAKFASSDSVVSEHLSRIIRCSFRVATLLLLMYCCAAASFTWRYQSLKSTVLCNLGSSLRVSSSESLLKAALREWVMTLHRGQLTAHGSSSVSRAPKQTLARSG